MSRHRGVVLDASEKEFFLAKDHRRNICAELPDNAKEFPVMGGYGYYGVLLYDPNEDRVQCHFCGKWYKGLGSHIRLHGVDADEYKETFELNNSTPLACLSFCEDQRERAIEAGLFSYIHSPNVFVKGEIPNQEKRLGAKYTKAIGDTSDARRKKISQSRKDLYSDPEARERQLGYMRKAHAAAMEVIRGKPLSEERKKRLSEAHKGRVFSEDTIQRMTASAREREAKYLATGEHPRAKLSREQAQQVRDMFATGNYTHRQLGKMFSVSKATIGNIIHRVDTGDGSG